MNYAFTRGEAVASSDFESLECLLPPLSFGLGAQTSVRVRLPGRAASP